MELRYFHVADRNHQNNTALRYDRFRDPLPARGPGMGSAAERQLQRAIGPAFGLPTGTLNASSSRGILEGAFCSHDLWVMARRPGGRG